MIIWSFILGYIAGFFSTVIAGFLLGVAAYLKKWHEWDRKHRD